MATRKQTAELVEISKASQGYRYTELTTAANGDRLRVVIYSDAYDFQSYARVERWDGEKWQNVWSIHHGNMATKPGLHYRPERATAFDFRVDRESLLIAAAMVLGCKVRA